MRIAVVSAHWPPEFVSGGTLQPQSVAAGLAARGHDVRVFAGSLDRDRSPLATRDTPDDVGLPVRWLAIAPFGDWGEVASYDNPGAGDQFARWLREWSPEVVHLHALQGLGCGLVEAAADSGARVVVTMHDFWWRCARHFLVEATGPAGPRPCCPVVDCGVCPCEVDRPWLERRWRRLAGALARADVVLAPSAAAADVLAANGVPPPEGAPAHVVDPRLRVDENGLDVEVDDRWARRPTAPGGVVRFAHAGGADPLKGLDVVLGAARRLAGRPGWHLTCYGVDPARLAGAGPQVDAAPAYAPAELDDVLWRTDVVVVASLARETFSRLAREALARGVAVVGSDAPGLVEALGGDGGDASASREAVVPAGDATALAAAMARHIERGRRDPDALRVPSRPPRPLERQVVGTEELYSGLLDPGRAAAPHPDGTGVGRVVFAVGIEGAPLRYRVRLPAEALGLLGVDSEVYHYADPRLATAAERADVLVVYRAPATPALLEVIAGARARGVPVLFDVDDLVVDPTAVADLPALDGLGEDERAHYLEGVRRYRTTLEACDAFVASTEPLGRHVAALTGLPTEVFGNGVGLVTARAADRALRRARRPGPLRVGYLSGTTTHDDDWATVAPSVVEAVAARPGAELWLVGPVEPGPAAEELGDRLVRRPFQPFTALPGLVRDLDVNLAPLRVGEPFAEAKSAIKWLEAALVETPTVAAATEPFRAAVAGGETGVLVSEPGEWGDAVGRLLDDAAERRRMGAAARHAALVTWSPHLQGRRYLALLERAGGYRGAPRLPEPPAPWSPVVVEEPARPVRLEPYGESPPWSADPAARARHEARRGREVAAVGMDLARRAARSARDEGPAVAAAKAGRWARRRLLPRLRGPRR